MAGDKNYLFIQFIGFAGTLLFFLSFQFKENKKLFRIQFLSYMCYTLHLLLLGALTGGISYVLNTFRSFCLGSQSSLLKSRYMCAAICFLQMLAMVFTWHSWLSILPVAANIASTIAGYTDSPKKIRIAGMFLNSPLWIIYDIMVGSWAGILDEIVSEASMILSILRYGWKNLDNKGDKIKT